MFQKTPKTRIPAGSPAKRGRQPKTVRSQAQGHKTRKGNAVIEFAVVFPAIILMMGTLFQFGHAFMVYNTLETAVRGGARYASIADYDAPDGTSFKQNVKNVVVYGAPNPADEPPILRGLSVGQVVVDSSNKDGSGIPISISVSINGFTLFKVFDAINLNGKPESTFTYMGQFKTNI